MAFGGGAIGSSAIAASPLAGGYDIFYIGVASGTSSVVGIGLSLFPAIGSASGSANVNGIGIYCSDPHLKKLIAGTAKSITVLPRHTC